ncbi:MAG: hypothetical protein ACO327_07220 [Gemmatimonadaceae bacterium]
MNTRAWVGYATVVLVIGSATLPAQEARSAGALWKAAIAAVDSGQFAPADRQTRLYADAARWADSAARLAPRDPDARVVKAIAAGRTALSLGPRERVQFAVLVRSEVLAALAIAPDHAGAHHVLGMWHAEILRLNPVARFAARTLLGAAVFGEANWDQAQRSMERAVALEPDRITHRLDLAGVLADRGNVAGARAQYEWIARAAVREYNAAPYKRLAAERLRAL